METTKLKLEQLRRDGGTQPRAWTDMITVNEYAEAMGRGEIFPALGVLFDGTNYWLWDGFHRCEAAEDAGIDELDCNIEPGTQTDAQWRSYSANGKHGLRRTNADKRRAVEAALRMKPELSDRAIAEHVGVDHKTVGTVREVVFPPAAGETPQSETRVGRDGRETNVAGINAGRAVTAEPMSTNAERFRAPDPLPFVPKAAPPGGWPVAGEDGMYDDERAEVLVDAVAKRWCDIKILELEPIGLFHRGNWIAAFSIGCKPCIYSEPLTEDGEEYDTFPTREEALADAAMRLAMYCWRQLQDDAPPETAKEVLERFREWALRTGEISEDQFNNQVRDLAQAEERRLNGRVEDYANGISTISMWYGAERKPPDNYERLAELFVQAAREDPKGNEADALACIDDVLERITAFAAAVKAIPAEQEEASVAD